MSERLDRIKKERKLKGLTWADLAKGLSVSGEAIRVAFYRGKVDDVYLEEIEKTLGLKDCTECTDEEKEKTPLNEVRFEDLLAKKIVTELDVSLEEKYDLILKAIMNLHIELNEIKNRQAESQETLTAIEKRV